MGIAAPSSDVVKAHSGESVDQILDWGAKGGIAYLQKFYPMYLQAWPNSRSLQGIEARYDEQRGMNLAKMSETCDAVSSSLGEAQTQQYTQQNCAIRLQSVWSGGATSATAHRMATEQVRLAGSDIEVAQAAVKALETFVDTARTAVTGKAANVRNIAVFDGDEPKFEIDGKGPDDIQLMLDIRNAKEWVDSRQAEALADLFPERKFVRIRGQDDSNESYSGRNPINKKGGLGEASQIVANYWLDHVFKPDIDGKLNILDAVCDQADSDINNGYKLVADAMNAVHDTKYPRPALAQDDNAPGGKKYNGPSGNGNDQDSSKKGAASSSPGPSATKPASTTDDPGDQKNTSPTSTAPSNSNSNNSNLSTTLSGLQSQASSLTGTASSALNGLGGAMNSVVSQGQSAIGALSGQIEKSLDGVLKSAGGASGAPVAEFDVAGKHLKLELGAKGGLALNLSDATGDNKSYTLKLDEHGIPVITTEDQGASGPHEPSNPQGASGSHDESHSRGASGNSSSTPSDTGNRPSAPPSSDDHTSQNQNSAPEQPESQAPGADAGAAAGPENATRNDHSTDDRTENQPPAPTQPLDSGAELPEAGPL